MQQTSNNLNFSKRKSAIDDSASDAISRKLKEYYDSLEQETIPDRFLDLLEKLDQAEAKNDANPESGSETKN